MPVTYRRIRSLQRGIDVLRFLNSVKGAQPTDICKELKLPRPTVHRILETLEEMKLVHRGYNAREFRLTGGVQRLARAKGVHEELRQAAWPVMHELTARYLWPCDLAVFQDNAMLIIESTHRLSPFSSDIGMVGRQRLMLLSPLGRAFLSHCDAPQRALILEALAAQRLPDDGLMADREAIDRIVEQGRRDGFSMCPELPHTRCASIAVPIRAGGEVVAAMNLVWDLKEMPFDQAREQLGPPLLAGRDRIERHLADLVADALSALGGEQAIPVHDAAYAALPLAQDGLAVEFAE
nr:helix-turn-helix domain-containing protein [Novosphingobium sp. SG720]